MTVKAPTATTRVLTVSTPKALMMPMAAPIKTGGTKKVPSQYKKTPAQKKKKTNIDVVAYTCQEIQC